jgi:hypothetical protein
MKKPLYVLVGIAVVLAITPALAQTDSEDEAAKSEEVSKDSDDAAAPTEESGATEEAGSAEETKPTEEAGPPEADSAETEAEAGETEEVLDEEVDKDNAFLTDTEVAEIEAPEEEKDVGLHEDDDEKLFSLGVRLRWIMIPEWFVKMFGVDTLRAPENESNLPLVSNIGVGPEFTYRKGGFDITAAVWYVGLGWDDPISFKGSDQDVNSWEVVTNDMSAILITFDFIWSTSITDWFAITYGAGLGLGIPWGDIKRDEARNGRDYSGEIPGTNACTDTDKITDNNPNGDPWCQPGEEYGEIYEGLPVVPWVEFLLGMRFKPHRHLVIHVDGGFGLGFQVGTRIGYIF